MCEDLAKIIAFLFIIFLFCVASFFGNTKIAFTAQAAEISHFSSISSITQAEKLVKTTNNPAVFAILNGKKHIIPNEAVFLSYGYKWDDIEIIDNEELQKYPNLRLAKLSTNDTIYYINLAKKIKKPHLNMDIFFGYGNKLDDVETLSEDDLNIYNEPILAKTKNSPQIYLVKEGFKKLITSPAIFESSGYKWKNILEISEQDLENYELASPLTEEDIQITSNNSPLLATDSQENLSGNLIISLETNKENFIPTGVVAEFAKINLSASNGAVRIEGLTVTISGIISDADIDAVYLINEDDYFNEKAFLRNKKADFSFSEELIIEEGEKIKLILKASTKHDPDSSYRTAVLSINKAEDIITSSNIQGNFPISSELKQLRYVENLIGRAEIRPLKVNYEKLKVNQGAKDQKVGTFEIKETSGNEKIAIQKIAFYVEGNINHSDLVNIDLVDDCKKILQTTTWMRKDHYLEFNLKYPIIINKNYTEKLTLQADIVGVGEKEFRFMLDKENTKILGISSQYEILPEIYKTDNDYNKLIIKKGDFLAYLLDNSPEEVIAGTENALLGIFELRCPGAGVDWRKANLTLNYTKTPLLGELRFINLKTKEEFFKVSADLLKDNKPIEINPNESIKAGSYLRFEVRGDISKNASAAENIKFKNLQTNVLQVKTSALYITPEEIDDNFVAGSKKITIGKFTIQANESEDIYIRKISIKSQEGYTRVNTATGFNNIRLNIARSTKAQTLNTSIVFDFKRPYKIRAGKSIDLNIYADTDRIASDNMIAMVIDEICAYGKESEVKPKVEGLNINSSSIQFTALNLEGAINTEFTDTVVNCGKEIKIGSFTILSDNEDIKINKINLETTDNSEEISYRNGFTNLTLKNGKRRLGKITKPLPDFNLFKNTFTVKKGETMTVDIYVDIPDCYDCDNGYLQLVVKSIEGYGASSKVEVSFDDLIILNKVKVECSGQDGEE